MLTMLAAFAIDMLRQCEWKETIKRKSYEVRPRSSARKMKSMKQRLKNITMIIASNKRSQRNKTKDKHNSKKKANQNVGVVRHIKYAQSKDGADTDEVTTLSKTMEKLTIVSKEDTGYTGDLATQIICNEKIF